MLDLAFVREHPDLIRDVARGLAAEDRIATAGGLLAQFKAGFRETQPDATSN